MLFLDEAHLLHWDMLDHLHILHILLNDEWDRRALLSLVLVGVPDLEERLGKRRNRKLQRDVRSRCAHRTAVHLDDVQHAYSR